MRLPRKLGSRIVFHGHERLALSVARRHFGSMSLTTLADRYRIERELGAGGMATVYLAEDLRHDREVAIKVLHPELAAALGGERFLSEIKTTAKLQHPHILPLLDSGEADGVLFYVMPYVAGETLRARLERERQLPIDDALRITREVADALASAHALGIIHRDIKPENILLQGGHALVADFGIALAVQTAGGQRMTQTGLSLGTPQYMSPEQAMGERMIDARADIYALGAVLYEMLTGDPPFTGSSVQAIVAKVMTEKPTAPRTLRDTVTPGVEDAVLRALSKLPADRFGSAKEFALALDAPGIPIARAGRPTAARSPRRAALGASLAAVACIAIAGAWWLGRRGARPANEGTVIGTSIMLPDAVPLEPLVPVQEGLSTLALSPDGSSLVFVGRKGASTQLFMRRLSEFTVRPIDGTDGAYSPFFSPNGDAVAFFVGTELRRLTLADQRVSTLRESITDPWGGTWTPDGRIIVSRQRAMELVVLNVSGDSLAGINCSTACSYPELLPDGRHVIVSSAVGLRILALADGSARPIRKYGDASDASIMRGSMGRLDGDGHLVWVAPNGDILVAPFDASNGSLTAAPVTIGEGARVESGRGAAQFAVARSGLIAFAPGPLMSIGILVRADRAGKLDTIPVPPADYNGLDLSPDGRRVLAVTVTPNGENRVNVIDVSNGQVTPWLTSTSADRVRALWDADGRHAYVVRGKTVLRGDPTVSTPPDTVRIRGSVMFRPLSDGKLYLENRGDTVVIERADGSGESSRVVTVQGSGGGVTADGRWEVMQENVGSSAAVVARALDGSGRRFIVPRSETLGMVWAAQGTNEFIAGGNPPESSSASADAANQTFWSFHYDPTAAEPFGTPVLLFAAHVADFPGRNYAVDRNARSFVFKQHVTAPAPHEIRVIQQWHSALTARSASGPSRR